MPISLTVPVILGKEAGLSGEGIGDASKFDCSQHTAVKPGAG